MPKSPDAFRTISEVADWLGIQAHVLRFWESKFTQVKPIKRAGGRRYYRPADMQLLGGIKKLLHEDGLTIKGVQKILREEGMSHVAAMSVPLDDADAELELKSKPQPAPPPPDPPAEAVVLPFEAPKDDKLADGPAPIIPDDAVEKADAAPDTAVEETQAEPPHEADAVTETAEAVPEETLEETSEPDISEPDDASTAQAQDAAAQDDMPVAEDAADETVPEEITSRETVEDPEQFERAPVDAAETPEGPPADDSETSLPDEAPLPSSLNENEADSEVAAEPQSAEADTVPADEASQAEPKTTSAELESQPAPKPRDIGMPDLTPEHEIKVQVSSLSSAYALRSMDAATAREAAPLLEQLTALRDRMAARRGGAQPKT